MSCSWPTAETIGTSQDGDRADHALVGERKQIFEAAPAAGEHDHVGAALAEVSDRRADRGGRARSLNVGLGNDHVRGGKPLDDVRQHVTFRRCVVAGDEPDQSRVARHGALARVVEEPLGRERALQPLERREVRPDAEALDRQCLQAQLAALRVELGAPEDVHALAVAEPEPQRVELAARHLHGEAGAVLGILQREEDRRPAILAPQLGDLALDPERGQLAQIARDPAVERADAVDLPPFDLGGLDLHAVDASDGLIVHSGPVSGTVPRTWLVWTGRG